MQRHQSNKILNLCLPLKLSVWVSFHVFFTVCHLAIRVGGTSSRHFLLQKAAVEDHHLVFASLFRGQVEDSFATLVCLSASEELNLKMFHSHIY